MSSFAKQQANVTAEPREMEQRFRLRRALVSSLAVTALPGIALAQSAPQPVFGTPGKDAGWIPTPNEMVLAMLESAHTTSADYVVDLGSGDGRIPILAAKTYGTRAMGIELN